jgi:hypothetical protein
MSSIKGMTFAEAFKQRMRRGREAAAMRRTAYKALAMTVKDSAALEDRIALLNKTHNQK